MKGFDDYPEAHDGLSDNDFDIVEHFSNDEDECSDAMLPQDKNPAVAQQSSFPKALHRSKMNHGLGRGEYQPQRKASDGNLSQERTRPKQGIGIDYGTDIPGDGGSSLLDDIPDLSKMTEDEIKAEQQFLYEKLGKETCEFLIQRRLKKMMEHDSVTSSQNKDNTCTETRKLSSSATLNPPGSDIIPKEVTLSADINELRKIEWTNPVESFVSQNVASQAELKLHQLRFDFDGYILHQSENQEQHRHESSLYNHGLEADKPGYTVPELLELMQSTFKPQVQLATRAMCNIVHTALVGEKRYFGYKGERWHNYILHDIDIVRKMGYLAMENPGSVQILIDSLKCMSLSLFGEITPNISDVKVPANDKQCILQSVLMPLQEVLSYVHQDMGLDLYSWNPLTTNFSKYGFRNRDENPNSQSKEGNRSNNDEAPATDAKTASKSREDRVVLFYKRALNGELSGMDVEEIKKDLADAIGIAHTDYYMEQSMDSLIHLITHFSFINRLCYIMSQHQTNLVLQAYSLTVTIGITLRFGSAIATALLEYLPFMQRLREITSSLIVGTESHRELLDQLLIKCSMEESQNLQCNLSAVVLCCMRILSVFKNDAFPSFLDQLGAIPLVKQAVTQTYSSHLSQLFNMSMNRTCALEAIPRNMVIPCLMAIKSLNVWALQDAYIDTLDEMMPVIELEMLKATDLARTDAGLFNLFMDTNGLILAHVFMHLACVLEKTDMSQHVRFTWASDRFCDLLLELFHLKRSERTHNLLQLIYASFQIQNAYLKKMAGTETDKKMALNEKQTDVLSAMANYVVTVIQEFCNTVDESMIEEFQFQWYNWKDLVGNFQPVAPLCSESNGIDQIVIPVQICYCMQSIVAAVKKVEPKLHERLAQIVKVPFVSLNEKLAHLLFRYHKGRIRSLPYSGFDKGAESAKPMPLLESWASFINEFRTSEPLEASGYRDRQVDSIMGALAVSSCYKTIQGLVKRLSSLYANENIPSHERIMQNFKRFNKMVAENHTLGNARLALINFIAYVAVSIIHAITSSQENLNGQMEENFFLDTILHREQLTQKFLEWLPDFDAANHLIQAVINDNNNINWSPASIYNEALEVLIFRRLSMLLSRDVSSGTGINEDSQQALKDTWDDLVEHMKSAAITAKNEDVLMSGAPRSEASLDHEHDSLGQATRGVIKSFNSGLGDSPYVMAALMLLISVFSRFDCAVHVWADATLIVLLGRNVIVDSKTREVTCITPSGKLGLGPIYLYLPSYNARDEIRKKQERLLSEFTEEDKRKGNAIMAIVTSCLIK